MREFYFPLCASVLSDPALSTKLLQLRSCHQSLSNSDMTSLASLWTVQDALTSMPCFLSGYTRNCHALLLVSSSPNLLFFASLFFPFHQCITSLLRDALWGNKNHLLHICAVPSTAGQHLLAPLQQILNANSRVVEPCFTMNIRRQDHTTPLPLLLSPVASC